MKIYKYIFNYNGSITIKEIEATEKKVIYVTNANERIRKDIIDDPTDILNYRSMYSLSNDKVELFKKHIIENCKRAINDSKNIIKHFEEKIKAAENADIKYE